MPVKTSLNMTPDNVLKIRRLLGTFRFKEGGYCMLGEYPVNGIDNLDGVFFIEWQKAGHVQVRRIQCEPKYIVDQYDYFFNKCPDKILSHTMRHPALQEHFSAGGEPITPATILKDFLTEKIVEMKETAYKPRNIDKDITAFGALLDTVKKKKTIKEPPKPFDFIDWLENK